MIWKKKLFYSSFRANNHQTRPLIQKNLIITDCSTFVKNKLGIPIEDIVVKRMEEVMYVCVHLFIATTIAILALLKMAKLSELSWNIPNPKLFIPDKNPFRIPTIRSRHFHQWVVASLPPSTHILTSLLVQLPQKVRLLLV